MFIISSILYLLFYRFYIYYFINFILFYFVFFLPLVALLVLGVTSLNYPVADSTPVPSRSRTPIPGPRRDRGGGGGGDGVGGSVRVHSQRIFTINDEEIEQLVKARPNKGTSKVTDKNYCMYSVSAGHGRGT